MRQIVLDTETTGLDPRQGHRIIEVAGVEMVNRRLTHRHFHKYVNPQRDIDAGAQAVHGISREFLADKPLFADIVDEFLEFVDGAELVIHNAPFDVGFLNAELNLLGRPPVTQVCAQVLDTLRMAKELHPGKRNNLDALCERYAIENGHRVLHGALLDAEILADVYLAMTRGQDSLIVEEEATPTASAEAAAQRRNRPPLRVIAASAEEIAAHEAILAVIDKDTKGQCIWLADRQETTSEAPQ
jgi:DNA polymerase III subunit epsilon